MDFSKSDYSTIKAFIGVRLVSILGAKTLKPIFYKNTDTELSAEVKANGSRVIYTVSLLDEHKVKILLTFTIPSAGVSTKTKDQILELGKDLGLEVTYKKVTTLYDKYEMDGSFDIDLTKKKLGKFKDFLDL